MGIAPWGALGGGQFKTEAQRKDSGGRNMFPATEAQIKISGALEKIANKKKTIITSVALAYIMHKTPYVYPIVGGRKVDHLKGNIEALGLELSQEEMDEIEDSVPFELGFPHSFLSRKAHGEIGPGDIWLAASVGHFDFVDGQKVSAIGMISWKLLERACRLTFFIYSQSPQTSTRSSSQG